MTAHTKVGGSWQQLTAIHAKVSGTWQPVQAGYVKVAGVWQQFFSAAAVAISNQTISDVQIGTDANATYSVNSDGTVTDTGFIENWVTPTSAAPGSYEVRATKNSGDTPGGSALGTWLALSSSRTWTLNALFTGSPSVAGCSLTVEIRLGATVLSTATISLSADSEGFG